jgi:hypothetical protein
MLFYDVHEIHFVDFLLKLKRPMLGADIIGFVYKKH